MVHRTISIVTYNCNSVRTRLEAIIEWLAYNDPDVLCLQETKVADELFPSQDFLDMGYHLAFSGMKAYNGVAIISREAPDEVVAGFDDAGATNADLGQQDTARILRARFGNLWIVNTYVPQGYSIESPKFAYKLEWFSRLKAYFQRHFTPHDDVLWLGDLNVAPTDMDVHDPVRLREHVCFHPDVIRAFESVCEFGFVDVFRKHLPQPETYTFWDYRANTFATNKGWRIDHLLATPPLADRSLSVTVDKAPRGGDKPSDHTYVIGAFQA